MFFQTTYKGLLSHIPTLKTVSDLVELTTISPATFNVYVHNLRYFDSWLYDNNREREELPISFSDIKDYLYHLAEVDNKATSTITQRLWAIAWLHEINGYTLENNPAYHPSLRCTGKRINRIRAATIGTNKPQQAIPLRTNDLKKIIRHCTGKTGDRDRALLLLGFAAALRRSELAALHTDDLTTNPDGSLTITIRKSKTDQNAHGQTVTIYPARTPKYCPIANLQTWLTNASITSGYLFTGYQDKSIQPQTVGLIIRKCCERAGMKTRFTGHSLRRGLLITAAERGADINTLRVHARHTRSTMTERYIGQSHFKAKNPTKGVF